MAENNRVAIITGGSAGIGYGIAESLLKEGYKIAITSRSEARAQEAAERLNVAGKSEVIGFGADVRSFEDQQAVVEQVLNRWGQIDVFVANAGDGHFANIEELSIEKWHETIEINLTGPFYSIKASMDPLKESNR